MNRPHCGIPKQVCKHRSRLTSADRLEAATSRLEDMAMSLEGGSTVNSVNAVTPPQAAAPESPKPAPAVAPAPAPEPLPPQVEDFDALIKGDVQKFVDTAQNIGDLVAEQV
jgi:adenylyl cyclase-associated protein